MLDNEVTLGTEGTQHSKTEAVFNIVEIWSIYLQAFMLEKNVHFLKLLLFEFCAIVPEPESHW